MSLRFHGCRFRYGKQDPVLLDFTFEFPRGRTVLLGPNGAGKSTALSLGATFLRPDRGEVAFRGLSPSTRRGRAEYRRKVGWMPQHIAPAAGLTVREQVSYAGWLKGLSKREAWDRARPALGRVGLAELADRRSHRLSGGQLRRLGLAQSLVHEAELLLLDEPTAGLDPTQRDRFRDIVIGLSTDLDVIISTHQTEDLSELYDSVVVLEQGNVRFSGTTDEFLALADPATRRRPAEDAYARVTRGEI